MNCTQYGQSVEQHRTRARERESSIVKWRLPNWFSITGLTLASFPGRRPGIICSRMRKKFRKRFTYSLSVRKSYPEKYTNLLVVHYVNVEHSDVRACTQGVYSCLVTRLLRDYRQQHPQTFDSAIIRCSLASQPYFPEWCTHARK